MSPGARVPEHRRVLGAAVAGAVFGVAAGLLDTWQGGLLAGWLAAAATLLGWTWRDLHGLDAAATEANASAEDDSRALVGLSVVVVCVASLGAAATGLYEASRVDQQRQTALTVASLAAVALAWAVVHTAFTLRYAHEYYDGTPGGIDFPGGAPPTYVDFAYVAFGLGMAFQVSDTAITSPEIRRTVLTHTFVAYLFGTAIIAAGINVVAGLV